MKNNKKRLDNVVAVALDCDTYKKLLDMSLKEDRNISYLIRKFIMKGVNENE